MPKAEKQEPEEVVKEKYSADDLAEVFNCGDFRKIRSKNAVKYFINKKKSDTGIFLSALVGYLDEYENLERIFKHGVTGLDDAKKMLKMIDNFVLSFIGFAREFRDNKRLPDGSRISLFSSLRNKKLRTALVNFLKSFVGEQCKSLAGNLMKAFYVNVAANEIEKVCKGFKVDKYSYPYKGTAEVDRSKDRIKMVLGDVFYPIKQLSDKICDVLPKIRKLDDAEKLLMALAGERMSAGEKRDMTQAKMLNLLVAPVRDYLDATLTGWVSWEDELDLIYEALNAKPDRNITATYKEKSKHKDFYFKLLTKEGNISKLRDHVLEESVANETWEDYSTGFIFDSGGFSGPNAKAFDDTFKTLNNKLGEIFDKRVPEFFDQLAQARAEQLAIDDGAEIKSRQREVYSAAKKTRKKEETAKKEKEEIKKSRSYEV